MTDTLLPILLTLPPISLAGGGVAPMVTGLAGSPPVTIAALKWPQVAERPDMCCLNDNWNYQS